MRLLSKTAQYMVYVPVAPLNIAVEKLQIIMSHQLRET